MVARAALQIGLALGTWAMVGACGGDDAKGASGSGSGTDAALVAQAKSKLMECKLYEPKTVDADYQVEDEADRCELRCLAAATCTDLKPLRCSDTPSPTNPVALCLFKCPDAPADGYACSNGSKISHAAVCDGSEDCDDGGDEKSCPTYTCKDGEKVQRADIECDGFEDCGDGSDELGCAAVCN